MLMHGHSFDNFAKGFYTNHNQVLCLSVRCSVQADKRFLKLLFLWFLSTFNVSKML